MPEGVTIDSLYRQVHPHSFRSATRFKKTARPMKHIAVGVTESDFGDYKRENKLGLYRETYLLAEKMSYKDVARELGWLEGDKDYYLAQHPNQDGTTGLLQFEYQKLVDNRIKKVKRHVEQVEATFKSIEVGTFP